MRPPRVLLAVVVAVTVLAGACGSSDGSDGAGAEGAASGAAGTELAAPGPEPSTEPGAESATAALDEGRTPIDVRTPEEFEEGHVDGAQLVDAQSDEFDDLVADLDPDDAYVVYCRTGNRSAAAATRMREAGLDVVDGGAFADMTEAGWPTAP